MFVKDILHAKGNTVFAVHPDEVVRTVIGELRTRKIGSAIVGRWGAIEGIISERDIVNGLARFGEDALYMPVSEIMTAPAPTCGPDDELTAIMATMTHRRVRHIAVLSEGRLCGVISIGDVVKYRLDEIELEVNVLRDYARLTVATH